MWHRCFSLNIFKSGLQNSRLFNVSAFLILVVCGAFVLAGCSGPKRHAAFKGTGSPYYKGSGSMPKGGGIWKVGTPYKINGKTYYPKENTSYDKVGTASWYGPKFHRRKTANGEWFNMNDLTAAHPTLPMPIFAKVTNLQNGRHIVVRINDRGPYAHKREIDLSRASAHALGVISKGTAKVRVQYLGKAPLDGRLFADMPHRDRRTLLAKADGHETRQYASKKEDTRDVAENTAPKARSHSVTNAPRQQKIYIQAASYSNQARAANAKLRLTHAASSQSDKLRIAKADIGGRTWYRLRFGPFGSTEEARQALETIQTAGHSRAMIVAD